MIKNNSHLIIWDYPEKEPIKTPFSKVLLWRSFSGKSNLLSIPELTEKWSDYIREEYLDWIYKLGRFKIGEKSIIESLKIRNNFSAWWLGLIVEKSNFSKSIYINDVIRLLTLKRWIKDKKFLKVTLYSSNIDLSKSLDSYFNQKNINFKLIKIKSKSENNHYKITNKIRRFFFSLPHSIKGLIWLIYKIIHNIPLINVGIKNSKKDNKNHIFISYLFNMNNSDIDNFFYSTYWGKLPRKLKEDKKYSTWIHLYVKDKNLSNTYKASKVIRNLNNNNKYQTHITLFSFFNLRVFIKVIWDLILLNFQIRKINLGRNFPAYKGFNFWSFYKNDWYDSYTGVSAIDNLIYLALFEEALKSCHPRSTITYLLENQAWEIGMLSVCRSFNIKNTIGFSHATSRYWDLRNFYDLREFKSKASLSLPRPKILAVNSKNVLYEFLRFGYPKNDIRLAEALRHSYLIDNHNSQINEVKKGKTFLILGDYEDQNTKYQLSVLSKINEELLNDLQIIFKPHPASRIDISYFNSLKIKITDEPISDLLPLSTIVFCGSTTSASVDAFSYGLKVIVLIDPKILNLSPLRKFKEVSFVRDSDELEKVIIKFFSENIYCASRRVIFELSEDLPLWRNLLYENT